MIEKFVKTNNVHWEQCSWVSSSNLLFFLHYTQMRILTLCLQPTYVVQQKIIWWLLKTALKKLIDWNNFKKEEELHIRLAWIFLILCVIHILIMSKLWWKLKILSTLAEFSRNLNEYQIILFGELFIFILGGAIRFNR